MFVWLSARVVCVPFVMFVFLSYVMVCERYEIYCIRSLLLLFHVYLKKYREIKISYVYLSVALMNGI